MVGGARIREEGRGRQGESSFHPLRRMLRLSYRVGAQRARVANFETHRAYAAEGRTPEREGGERDILTT